MRLINNQRRFAPIPGRFAPDQVADFSRNRRPTSSGLGGRNHRNRHIPRQDFSFSLYNKLREPVKDVVSLVIFYDKKGYPIDIYPLGPSTVIPPRLAKMQHGEIFPGEALRKLTSKVEIRVLSYKIVEQHKKRGKMLTPEQFSEQIRSEDNPLRGLEIPTEKKLSIKPAE